MNPSLQAVGHQCGIDVDSLLKKYSGGAPKNNTGSDSVASTRDARDEKTTNTDKLDRIRICKGCHGYGLVKEMYNHQVKEVNCGYCEGEGIIEI